MTKRTALIGFSLTVVLAMGLHYALRVWQAFQFKITGYGIPSYSNNILRLPINIQFDNPAAFTVTADNLLIEIYLRSLGKDVLIGTVNQGVSLPPGKSTKTVIPVINIMALGTLLIDSWENILDANRLDLRTDITVTYQGIKLPKYEFEDSIKLL